MVNVWRLMAQDDENYQLAMIQWAIAIGRIAIGWGRIGNLSQYASSQKIVEAICREYPGLPKSNKQRSGDQLWNFYRMMQCGDLVILKTKVGPRKGWQNSVVMQVKGPYEHVDEQPPYHDYQNQREAVQVTNCDPQALWEAAGRMAEGEGQFIRNALIRCQNQVGGVC